MIKIKYLLTAVVLLVALSCSKDGNGKLSIKLNSFSNSTVAAGQGMQLVFDFTESGSVIDSIGLIKLRINQLQTATLRDTIFYFVPVYPKSTKGQLFLNLSYFDLQSAQTPPQTGIPPQDESDSLIFKFFAKDMANNTSDTVTTGLIVVQRIN
jgi:hypothetical protein